MLPFDCSAVFITIQLKHVNPAREKKPEAVKQPRAVMVYISHPLLFQEKAGLLLG
jgi:hypothetical protein